MRQHGPAVQEMEHIKALQRPASTLGGCCLAWQRCMRPCDQPQVGWGIDFKRDVCSKVLFICSVSGDYLHWCICLDRWNASRPKLLMILALEVVRQTSIYAEDGTDATSIASGSSYCRALPHWHHDSQSSNLIQQMEAGSSCCRALRHWQDHSQRSNVIQRSFSVKAEVCLL